MDDHQSSVYACNLATAFTLSQSLSLATALQAKDTADASRVCIAESASAACHFIAPDSKLSGICPSVTNNAAPL